jgi:hypothetical protein
MSRRADSSASDQPTSRWRDEAIEQLDEISPGPPDEAPGAYAW